MTFPVHLFIFAFALESLSSAICLQVRLFYSIYRYLSWRSISSHNIDLVNTVFDFVVLKLSLVSTIHSNRFVTIDIIN